jgi:hypothetical protein
MKVDLTTFLDSENGVTLIVVPETNHERALLAGQVRNARPN